MENVINDLINKMVAQPCTRREVGRTKSLSLGFGDDAKNFNQGKARQYKVWEVGTYYNAWRIVKGTNVLLSNIDSDNLHELNLQLNNIELGRFASLRQLTDLDVRVELDNGIAVDFLGTINNEDEYFHVFCPDNLYIEFSNVGWKTGHTDKPWDQGT